MIRSLFVLVVAASPIWGDTRLDTAKIDAAVKNEMEAQALVGVAIGIIRDGRIVYIQAYGEADREKRTPYTAGTVTNWASNSKPLVAVLAMQLVEKGLLDLDADVREYVPEFPDKKAKITCRHILSHQSGIPHYRNGRIVPTERKYSEANPFMNPIHSLDKFNGSPLIFEPGEKVSYSSYAYILLSAVIQKSGRKPFREQVTERITNPLKLESFEWDTGDGKTTWSTGYSKIMGNVVRSPEEANDWKHGAGGFKSNIRDFARWAQALVNHELVGKTAERQMWTMQPLRDKSATSWGLGFTVKGKEVSHNGSQGETKTRLVLVPEERRGLVVMSNCSHADVNRLAAAVDQSMGSQ